jgi:PAS domain S-box-containing protein
VKPLSNRPASTRERALLADTRAAKERLATVLESISDGFFALDRDWAYTALNDQACESMGMSRNETLGRTIWDVRWTRTCWRG